MQMRNENGSIVSPKGFRASGIACGIKKNGAPDVALIVSDVPATCAATFTRNLVKGHSLQLSMRHIQGGLAKAFLINSGNANACVGPQGDRDATDATQRLAARLDCPVEQILFNSTGVIGIPLPIDKLLEGIDRAVASLSADETAGHAAEAAIMTTDTIPKEVTVSFEKDGRTVTVSGMAKGSGMIHPDMATMIGVLTTDCAVDAEVLGDTLRKAVATTFNRVTVDGDTSVCDMVAVFANGLAENKRITEPDPDLTDAFCTVCEALSRMLAKDGEGATKLIEVKVVHACTPEDAYRVALSVAKSPLVKTMIFGEDANWGRILTAVGYSGANIDPARCGIRIGGLEMCRNGAAIAFDEAAAKTMLSGDEILIEIDLQNGNAWDRFWTCDFTYDYVKINGSYRS